MSEGDIDRWLAQWDRDFHSVARYTIVRCDPFKPNRVVATGLEYAHARSMARDLDIKTRIEIGCSERAFGRPIHVLQLEHPEATYATFQRLRAA